MTPLFLQIAMVFGTSRGRNLDIYLKPKSEAVVFFRSGGRINQIKEDACAKIDYYKRKYLNIHVYFLVGIPDITSKVSMDAYEETILTKSITELTETFTESLLDLSAAIKKKGCEICICTIASLDMEKWNHHRLSIKKSSHLKHESHYNEWQKTVEEGITQINKFIVELNITNHMITPFIGDTVMTKKKSRVKKYYERLPDGLHPGEDLLKKWGEIIANRIDKNFSMSRGATDAVTPPAPETRGRLSPNHSPKRNWKTY